MFFCNTVAGSIVLVVGACVFLLKGNPCLRNCFVENKKYASDL